jgi:hypothetical protein
MINRHWVSMNSNRILHLLVGVTGLLLAINLALTLFPSSTNSVQENASGLYDFSLPGSFSLCHEPIPLENRHVLEMLDREFIIAVLDRAQVVLWLKRSGRYFPYIEAKLAEAGLPDDLKYVAVAESALLTDIRSRKGAVGLWQFVSRTGRRYGLKKSYLIDQRLDYERSTEAAIRYLKRLHEKFGSWTLAMAAYNCGETALQRAIRKQNVNDFYRLHLPPETERYIFRIAAIKIIMENPKRYGFDFPREHTYPPRWYDTVEMSVNHRVKLADLAGALDTDYKVLKELNPQFRRDYLPKGTYSVKVPPGCGPNVVIVLQQLGQTDAKETGQTSGSYYLVRRGDTLGHISQKTGIPIAQLRRFNGIAGSSIYAGQRLKLTP